MQPQPFNPYKDFAVHDFSSDFIPNEESYPGPNSDLPSAYNLQHETSSPWHPTRCATQTPQSSTSVGSVRCKACHKSVFFSAMNEHVPNCEQLRERGKFQGKTAATVVDDKRGKKRTASREPEGSSPSSKKIIKPVPQVREGRPNGTPVNYDKERGLNEDKNLPYWHFPYEHNEPLLHWKPEQNRNSVERSTQLYSSPSSGSAITGPSRTYSSPKQHNFQGARGVTMSNVVFNNVGRDQIHQNFHDHSRDVLWEAIRNVGAFHNSEIQVERGHCLPGTRQAVLQLIHEWRVSGSQSPPVCWLSGAAGVGKSAIALTVADECEKDGLVASFFFFRSDPRRNNPSSLILSIAHGLVMTRPHLKPLVNWKITANPTLLEAKLEYQYEELVLEHLSLPSAKRCPDIVIIDGLDECSNGDTQQRVLSIIFSTYEQPFHSPLRFLICSRPESWIRESFESRESRGLKHIKLDDAFRPRYDIELYFDKQFRDIRRDPKYKQVRFPNTWPSPEDLELLLEKADGQFVYASTVIKFIKADYTLPTYQLRIILDAISKGSSDSQSTHAPFNDLDELYLIVLRANPDRHKHLLSILAAILIVQNPSSGFIELLLGLPAGMVALTLRAMHSVLDIRDWEDEIRVYHTSFADFLFDRARSKEFFINGHLWYDFMDGRWSKTLREQCKKDPELLRSDGDSANSALVRRLVREWNDFLRQPVTGREESYKGQLPRIARG
ncbi:hypothetical protein E1B28_005141 [Marasmius oreades]|uniref:Nephrocystin 3-like N-terminal domain-containing protein n=1 Tax=Marasmius oreades TaxID=181124 RepID=A0A9P7V029_9AGAR|nr:uncharacterized protein E1B28_005141 [Marasmius oreades]KAG7097823.1 hypothetical protein E1B28_005141 [Marasmius oreades]